MAVAVIYGLEKLHLYGARCQFLLLCFDEKLDYNLNSIVDLLSIDL